MKIRIALSIALLFAAVNGARASYPVDYRGEIIANAGTGDFAPYYIASNNFGIMTQPYSALARASVWRGMEMDRRFSYGFGIDALAGYASSDAYLRYNSDDKTFTPIDRHPARVWLQQLYGELKYRCLFLTVGLKETGSALLDDRLSSGDITWSANARPMPGVRAGFHGFEDIPFTNGWVQINGVLFYGKPTDNDWLTERYNYFNAFITTGRWINYKRVYFRTKPSKPLSVAIGMQAAAQFGGTQVTYENGLRDKTETAPAGLKEFFQMLVPGKDDKYWSGNHLGSWDVMARYRLRTGHEIKLYLQSPWEDGSGIGKLNGFDGLWGIEYKSPGKSLVSGAVIEYLDFTNQSGPLHWDPVDNPGTTVANQATGADSYYNNYFYNGYAYYGMSQGTPFLMSPLYNLDGYMRYIDTRVRGFHAAVEGSVTRQVDYRAMVSHRISYGDSYIPRLKKAHDTSWMVEAQWRPLSVPGLTVKAQVAMDSGDMYGDNFGAMLSISYRGVLNLR